MGKQYLKPTVELVSPSTGCVLNVSNVSDDMLWEDEVYE